MLTFTNPRLHAEFADWPNGFRGVVPCVFNVEHNAKKGYRVTRQTTGKVKADTYGGKAAIVAGSDGKTYILQFAGVYDCIKVARSDFMCADGALATDKDLHKHSAWPEDDCYMMLKNLILQANA